MKTTQPALRPYLETIEKHCQPLDRDSLMQLFLNLAKQVEPAKRNDFLQVFKSELPGNDKRTASATKGQLAALLAEIEELRQGIQARIVSIEDGSYWDNPDDEDDWKNSHYLDEEPDLVNDWQENALVDFFTEADSLFLHGEKKAAQKTYGALLSLINEAEDHGYLPDFNVDLREARARLARCVYDLSSREERVEAVLAVINAGPQEDHYSGFRRQNLPMFRDIMDTETSSLEDLQSFLPSWQTALGKYHFTNIRTADLQLEAALLQNGIAGVKKLARQWGEKQPLGYLSWLQQLEEEGNWQELRDAAREPITALPSGSDRRKAASYLVTAGKKLDEDNIIITGYREKFRSKPGHAGLLELTVEASRQRIRQKELKMVHTFLSERKPQYGEEGVLVKSLLMAGEIDQAFSLCQKDNAVGWSSGSATGVLYASTLYLLSNTNPICTLVQNLLEDYSSCNAVYFNCCEDHSIDLGTSGFLEIQQGLDLVDTTSINLDRYWQWSGNIGEQRVNHIVSNKHRGAYERAAMVLGSLAETMAANAKTDKAQSLLHEYCRVLYNRHIAFRREVKKVVDRSEILRGMIEGL